MRLDHIGIAVRDLEAAVRFYRDVLGLELEEVPEERVRVATLRVGDVRIELLQGTDPESAVSKFVREGGRGGAPHSYPRRRRRR